MVSLSANHMKRHIFIIHGSHHLTDHAFNGDGLVAWGFVNELARRGHRLHVLTDRLDVAAPVPPNCTLVEPDSPVVWRQRLENGFSAGPLRDALLKPRRATAKEAAHEYDGLRSRRKRAPLSSMAFWRHPLLRILLSELPGAVAFSRWPHGRPWQDAAARISDKRLFPLKTAETR